MFNTMNLTAGGLKAQRTRMDVIAGNVANANTVRATKNADGTYSPYQRRIAMLEATGENSQPGVRVKEVALDPAPFDQRYEPGHPDADPTTGLVAYPNVDLSTEYVNMLEATRAYEANISLMQTTKAMFNASLRLLG